ncbi:hypothetical protein AOQ84DRAFT_390573, partial [Glonium stellatum]
MSGQTITIESASFPSALSQRKIPVQSVNDEFENLVDLNGNEFKVPDYTIKDIRGAIPPECFNRSTIRGLGYVLRDLVLLSSTFYLFNTYATPAYVPWRVVRFALWSLYGFLNGLFGTGIWVLAHECGHYAFSPSKTVNDTVGWLLHSALLVPYFSWKISHGKHHKSTGHMERDMVFVPRTRAQYAKRFGYAVEQLTELAEDTPAYTASFLLARQLFGWPVYLLANDTGHNYHEGQPEGRGRGKANGFFGGVNHFNPSSPLFEAKDAKYIALSDLGLLMTGTALYLIGSSHGWWNLAVWYFLPWMWVNHWLVAITFLQHTDPTLPHYTATSWTFLRGAATTIDRDLGPLGRHLFHGIVDTHVLHHYVSSIPFYHAARATRAIRPVPLPRRWRGRLEGVCGGVVDGGEGVSVGRAVCGECGA